MSEEKPTILLVEDDKILHENAATILLKEFIPSSSFNGNAALAHLHRHTPDAILLDIRLPDKDGFEVLKYIRSDERFDQTTVIMFTNLSSKDDRGKAMNLGADLYCVKVDVDIYDLPKIIKNAIKKKRG